MVKGIGVPSMQKSVSIRFKLNNLNKFETTILRNMSE